MQSEIAGYRRRTPAFKELERLASHAGQLEWLLRCKPGGATPEEWESLWRYLRDEVDGAARRLATLVAPGGDLILPRPRYVEAGPAKEESAEYVAALSALLVALPSAGMAHSP